jgi:hypothetical protein
VRDGEIIDPSGVLLRERLLSIWYFNGREDCEAGDPCIPTTPTGRERRMSKLLMSSWEQGWRAADARRKEAERNG